MRLIKTLHRTLKLEKEKFMIPKSVQRIKQDTADLAGWHLSVRQAVFKIVPFYGYQLFHCKQRG